MQKIIPKKLKRGSHIRIIAPSRSMGILSSETKQLAIKALEKEGFVLTFGKHVDEYDEFYSSSVESRIDDLHDAFLDASVDGILTVIGGYNANQILDSLDFDLIKNNPKYLCGYSDITVIHNAIYKKTGLISCNGPHFSSWAMQKGFDYSKEYFEKCCMQEDPYEIKPVLEWSDDPWYLDQEKREFLPTHGFDIIHEGEASGTIVGGHLRTFASLQGTEYFPSLQDSILLLEEDEETNPRIFDRLLQALLYLPDFKGVKGIIIGRFQKASKMSPEILRKIINSKKELKNIPILADFAVGHTTPISTLPIGGQAELSIKNNSASIKITIH